MNIRHVVLPLVAALTSFALPLWSIQGQQSQEPLLQELAQADAIYPQERGEVQVTMAPRMTRWADERLEQNALGVEYGMSDRLQFEAEVSGYRYRATRGDSWTLGLSALEIGMRRSWMNIGGSATHAALGLGFDIPVRPAGSEDDDKEPIAVQPSVVVAHDFAPLGGLQLLGNVTMDVPLRHGEDGASIAAHAAAVLPLGEVRLLSEVSRMQDEQGADTHQHVHVFLTPGVVVPLPGEFELLLATPIRLQSERRSDVMLKVTREF